MRTASRSILAFSLTVVASACGGSAPPATAPSDAEIPAATPTPDVSSPAEAPGEQRPALTEEECKAKGGVVVGDIGDGAIHRPDYRCPSGATPAGSIRAPEGGPIAVEGSVCCPQ